jgi:hypothetical protein
MYLKTNNDTCKLYSATNTVKVEHLKINEVYGMYRTDGGRGKRIENFCFSIKESNTLRERGKRHVGRKIA